ncbi:MAG: hypothetical protein IJ194_06120 [Bacilli bacterium]|nr:hypothetical protein [Bacilli bacterium]
MNEEILAMPKFNREELNFFLTLPIYRNNSEHPFPQADNIGRVFRILMFLEFGDSTCNQIMFYESFTQRQAQYYLNALMFLKLVHRKGKGVYSLTSLGEKCVHSGLRDRIKFVIEEILKNKVFRLLFEEGLTHVITKENANKIMHDLGYSPNTILRRSSTVYSWVTWCLTNFDVNLII